MVNINDLRSLEYRLLEFTTNNDIMRIIKNVRNIHKEVCKFYKIKRDSPGSKELYLELIKNHYTKAFKEMKKRYKKHNYQIGWKQAGYYRAKTLRPKELKREIEKIIGYYEGNR